MASASPTLPPMPGHDVPFMLPNGTINPIWFAWLKAAERAVRTMQGEV